MTASGQYTQPSKEILDSLAESEQLGEPSEEQDPNVKPGETNDEGTADEKAAAEKAAAEKAAAEAESKAGEEGGKGKESGANDVTGVDEKSAYEHEGKKYDKDALDAIIADHVNNENWKAENTQEAQKLAAASKSINAVQDLLKKISADEDAVELLSDYGYDLSEKGIKTLLTDLAIQESDGGKGEGGGEADTRTDLEKRMDDLEADRALEKALNAFSLTEAGKLCDTAKKQDELMQFMLDKNLMDFNEAHKLLTADQTAEDQTKRLEELEEENEKLKKNISPNAPVEGQAAKGTVQQQEGGPVHGDFNFDAARKKLRKALNLD